jgi:hypothetical protein
MKVVTEYGSGGSCFILINMWLKKLQKLNSFLSSRQLGIIFISKLFICRITRDTAAGL